MRDSEDATDAATPEPRVLNLDELEREPTGDPLIDRGLDLTLDELEKAVADTDHPDHDAAKAANEYLEERMRSTLDSIYGDTFRRIGENLTAAIKPNLANLFTTSRAHTSYPNLEAVKQQRHENTAVLHKVDSQPDETPARTLNALLEVSERMSEMVRVSAEHRDVALQQIEHFKTEAEASRKSERRMFVLTCLALIGTWGAVVVALLAI